MVGLFIGHKAELSHQEKVRQQHINQRLLAAVNTDNGTLTGTINSLFYIRLVHAWQPQSPEIPERIQRVEAKIQFAFAQQEDRDLADRLERLRQSMELQANAETERALKRLEALYAARNLDPSKPFAVQLKVIRHAVDTLDLPEFHIKLKEVVQQVLAAAALGSLQSIQQLPEAKQQLAPLEKLKLSLRKRSVDEATVKSAEPNRDETGKIVKSLGARSMSEGGLLDFVEHRINASLMKARRRVELGPK